MAGGYKFTIGADNSDALKAMGDIKTSLSQITSAFNATKKSSAKGGGGVMDPEQLNIVGSKLGDVKDMIGGIRVVQNQWQRDGGFKNLKGGFDDVAKSARSLFGDVMAILTPMEALTGAGMVAGLARAANSFNSEATKTKLSSFETGTSVQGVQEWVNLGRAFGVDGDQMRSTMTGLSQRLRSSIINSDSLLPVLQNQLGLKDATIGTINSPGGLDKLMHELLPALNRYTNSGGDVGQNAALRKAMIDSFGIPSLEPLMMATPSQYSGRLAAADKYGTHFTDSEIKKGQQSQYAWNDLSQSAGTFFANTGDLLSGVMARIFNFGAKSFAGDYTMDQKGLSNIDPEGLSRVRALFHGDFSAKNWSFFDHNNDIQQGGRTLGDNEPSGIAIPTPAPPQKVDMSLTINNLPPGSKLTVHPNPNVRVRPTINYSGFDNQ